MAFSLQLTTLITLSLLLCVSRAAVIGSLDATFTNPLTPPPTSTPPPPPQQLLLTPTSQELHDHSVFSQTTLIAPILSHLGFNELATAVPSLSADSSATTWSGPTTLFAPSDSSLRTCFSCSVPNLLREHIVPGLFTIDYLRKLAFGTKIETLSPGRCITVTSTSSNDNDTKIFIGGVEITHPDLFNNGLIVIHGIQGYVTHLSPFSCDVERMTSLSFPYQPDRGHHNQQPPMQPTILRLMIRDAMFRLRNNGFSILSLAMKVKYAELVTLSNMTVFALDDVSIFSGSHSYISNIRFHIVPNHFLTLADLEQLPVGTTLPTLEKGQSLVVTTAGVGFPLAPIRINYVRIKVPDAMRNLKVVAHSVYLPFPHIHPASAVYDGTFSAATEAAGDMVDPTMERACAAMEEHGGCDLVPMPQIKPSIEIEDHHGL